jgi:hypothetical protein
MDRLEEQLRKALARKEPPDGFAAKTIAVAGRSTGRGWRGWAAQGIAAAVVLVVAGGLAYRQHEGEVAKEQVMHAMRITAAKLNRIQARVREVER